MYVIVENLRLYLESEDIQSASSGGSDDTQRPLYLGERILFNNDLNDIYHNGGKFDHTRGLLVT